MDRLRIDKWLWAARFYKTRPLACDDLDLGRVEINGTIAKPSREVKPGDVVYLRSAHLQRTVKVLTLNDRRGPACVAALMYEETQASIAARQAQAEQRRLAPEPALGLTQGRPTKRERRQSDRVRAGQWNERWSASLDVATPAPKT